MTRTSWRAVAAVVLVAATGNGAAAAQPRRFATQSGRVELQFPADWYRDAETPFDLQASSKDDRMTTGVFEFHRSDLSAGTRPHDVLELQVEDMRSKRKNFVKVEDEKVVRVADRTFTTVVYAADMKLSRFNYRFTLVQFADPEVFLVLLQIAVPSEWKKSVPVFDAVLRSATLRPADAE